MKSVVFAIVLFVAAAAWAQPRGAHSLKGWEIYSWRAEGRWYFSLLEGAERDRSFEEIVGGKLDGVGELEDKLTLLKVGEEIAWGTGAHVRTRRPQIFAPPPAAIRGRILARCAALGLKIEARD